MEIVQTNTNNMSNANENKEWVFNQYSQIKKKRKKRKKEGSTDLYRDWLLDENMQMQLRQQTEQAPTLVTAEITKAQTQVITEKIQSNTEKTVSAPVSGTEEKVHTTETKKIVRKSISIKDLLN
jgi:hypothetical protein